MTINCTVAFVPHITLETAAKVSMQAYYASTWVCSTGGIILSMKSTLCSFMLWLVDTLSLLQSFLPFCKRQTSQTKLSKVGDGIQTTVLDDESLQKWKDLLPIKEGLKAISQSQPFFIVTLMTLRKLNFTYTHFPRQYFKSRRVFFNFTDLFLQEKHVLLKKCSECIKRSRTVTLN